jgi:hypothetical protein
MVETEDLHSGAEGCMKFLLAFLIVASFLGASCFFAFHGHLWLAFFALFWVPSTRITTK